MEYRSKQGTLKLPHYWVGVLVLLLTFFVSVYNINEPFFLTGVCLLIFLIWTIKKNSIKFTYFDLLLFIIWLFSLFTIFISSEPVSSFFYFRILTLSYLFYLTVRSYTGSTNVCKSLLFWCSIIIGLLCLVALASFVFFKTGVEYIGYTDVYDFRFRYKPAGYLSNIWGSLLLSFIGVVALGMVFFRKNKTILFILYAILLLVMFQVVISFSRGVYLSFLFLLLVFTGYVFFRKAAFKKRIAAILLVLIPLFSFGVLFKNDVVRTLKFNETVSQQRSIAGRQSAMQASWSVFKEAPIFGTGTLTFPMVIDDMRYQDDSVDYTNFAPNTYTQLLTEQGVAGVVLWLLLFGTLIFAVKKRSNPLSKTIGVTIFCTIIALLIREATFPVFLTSSGYQIVVFMLAGIWLNFSVKPHSYFYPSRKQQSSLLLALSLACLAVVIFTFVYKSSEAHNKMAIQAVHSKNLDSALVHISKTPQRTPYLVNRGMIHWSIFNETQKYNHLAEAKSYIKRAIENNKHDVMLQFHLAVMLKSESKLDSAAALAEELAAKYPTNGLYNLALFNLLYDSDKKQQALPYLEKLVEISPTIIEIPQWGAKFGRDTAVTNTIKRNMFARLALVKEKPKSSNPIELAKLGYLLMHFWYYEDAKAMLNEALTLMPNMSFPWYYLYKMEINEAEKMVYLKKFLFLLNNIHTERDMAHFMRAGNLEKILASRNHFKYDYPMKFTDFYRSSTISMYEPYFSALMSK